jgi:hypothetical protein
MFKTLRCVSMRVCNRFFARMEAKVPKRFLLAGGDVKQPTQPRGVEMGAMDADRHFARLSDKKQP